MRDAQGRFLTGNSGRPKGARARLGERFLEALAADFAEHGVATIEAVRRERPHEYLKLIAGLLPKQIEVPRSPFGELDDAELEALIDGVRDALETQH